MACLAYWKPQLWHNHLVNGFFPTHLGTCLVSDDNFAVGKDVQPHKFGAGLRLCSRAPVVCRHGVLPSNVAAAAAWQSAS